MPQLPKALRRERAARLRQAGARAAARLFAARIGHEEAVLFERADRGHTEHFAPLRLARGTAIPGEIRRLRVTGATNDALLAEAA
jgi:threonylcarbamoyladenosine tRNA methylthiotransferase MtaB